MTPGPSRLCAALPIAVPRTTIGGGCRGSCGPTHSSFHTFSRDELSCLVAFWLIRADWTPRSFWVGCRTRATTCTPCTSTWASPARTARRSSRRPATSARPRPAIVDVQEELCRDFAFPVLQWQAKYEGIYLLGTSIARPLISKVCLQVAREVGADGLRPRGHRQGERPVPLPAGRRGARSGRQDDRPLADREVPRAVSRPHRDDRLLRREEHPGQGVRRPSRTARDENCLHISYEAGKLEDLDGQRRRDWSTSA